MKVMTCRFGEIEIDDASIIKMKIPILGFDWLCSFAKINSGERRPFSWFQSLEDAAVAFIIADPFIIKQDYDPEIDDTALAMLEVKRASDINLMAIITVRSEPAKITANLRAPLVINTQKKIAGQIVLDDDQYPVQFHIG